MSQACFTEALRTEATDFKIIDELKGSFVPFIREVCMNPGITDINKEEIPTLAEFISA